MNVGDVVFLNSNPEISMTVEYVLNKNANGVQEKMLSQKMRIGGFTDGDVYCTWFDGKELKNACFKAKMLTKK